MKKIVFILLLSVSYTSVPFAQYSYAQRLIDLLLQDKCFEAREWHGLHRDKMPQNDRAFDLMYKSNMALFFNEPDSAIVYLEELLSNYEPRIGPAAGRCYGKLLQLYSEKQRFEDGINLCDRVIEYMRRNRSKMSAEQFQFELNHIEETKISFRDRAINEPLIKIERIENEGDEIKLDSDIYIRFDAKYNGITVKTWFDTGVSHYLAITKKMADKIGVKVVKNNQSGTQRINGVPTKAFEGIIDSIDLKSVKLYNIPVLVFNDGFTSNLPDSIDPAKRREIQAVFNDDIIMMGIPTMKLIERVEFDRGRRTVSFIETKDEKKSNDLSNMYLIDNYPYLKLKINGLDYVGFFDVGDNSFVKISSSFYEKNKSSLEIDTTIQKPFNHYFSSVTEASDNPLFEVVKSAELCFNNNCKHYGPGPIIISDATAAKKNTFGGIVGVDFLKELGSKIIIDFHTMRVEGEID